MAAAPSHRDRNRSLVRRHREGDPRAADELLLANEALITKIAGRYHPFVSSMEFADLMQFGRMGLWRALQTFDPSRGLAFSTYATHWIRQTIGRGIESSDALIRIPGYQRRPGQTQEGLPICEVSLDAAIAEGEDTRLVEMLQAVDDTEGEALARVALEESLALLPARERFVIEQRAAGVTLLQLAGALKCSRETVRRIEEGARALLAAGLEESPSPARQRAR